MSITINVDGMNIKPKQMQNASLLKMLKLGHDNLHSLDKSMGTGWVDLPLEVDKQEIANIKLLAKDISSMCDCLVVAGKGGAVQNLKAVLSLLKKHSKTQVIIVDELADGINLQNLLEQLKNKEVCLFAVSKSGETCESLYIFSVLETFMKKKYKKASEYKKRIFVATDYEKGTLRDAATQEGYVSYILPRTIEGEYSFCLTSQLILLAVAGVNIERLLDGVKTAQKQCSKLNVSTNQAYKLAICKFLTQNKAKKRIEIISCFDNVLTETTKLYQQLFAFDFKKASFSSFCMRCCYPTDIHEVGEALYLNQDHYETMIVVGKPSSASFTISIPSDRKSAFLNEKSIADFKTIIQQTHVEMLKSQKIPHAIIEIDEVNEESVGELLYILQVCASMQGYLSGINPYERKFLEQYKSKIIADFSK